MNHTNRNKEETGFRKALLPVSIAVMISGALGLFGWIFRVRIVTAVNSDYVPMAPDTAVIFMLFGAVLMAETLKALPKWSRAIVISVVSLATIYGLLKFIEFLTGTDLTFRDALIPPTEKVGSFPVWHMSPITGLMFFVSGVGLLVSLTNKAESMAMNIVAGLGVLVLTMAFVVTAGYIYGVPLLYGSDVIPLAAATAVGMMFFGAGLVTVAGPKNLFLRPFLGVSVYAKLLRILLPLTVVAAIAQGLLHEYVDGLKNVNTSLAAALTSLTFAAFMGAIAVFATRYISQSILRAESERIRVENLLRESEANLVEAQEIAIVGNFVRDIKNDYFRGSREYFRILGVAPAEGHVSEERFRDMVHPEDRQRVVEKASRFLADGKPYGHEYRIVLPDGSVRHIHSEIRGVFGPDGKLVQRVGTVQDVTERVKMENSLRESELRYRAIVDGASESISIVQDGKMKYVNPEWQRLTGYSYEEAMSITAEKFMHPDDYPGLNERRRLRAAGGEVQGVFNYRMVTKSGEIRFMEARAARISFEGRPATVMMHSDVTERKKAEDQIKLQADAMNAAANAIVITDREGIITWVNKAFTDLTGYEADEAMGDTMRLLKSGEQSEEYYRQMWKAIKAGKVWRDEVLNKHKDGTPYYVGQTVSPIKDQNGVITHFVAIQRDITARKKAEEALAASEARFRGLVELSLVGVYIIKDFKLAYANPKLCEIFGYSAGEITSLNSINELITPEDRELVADNLKQRLEGHVASMRYGFRGIRKDRSVIFVEVFGSRVNLEGEDVIIGTLMDVTNEKRVEEEVRRSNERYRSVVDTAVDAIIVVDVDGTVISWNKGAQEIFGYTPEEIVGRPAGIMVPEEYREEQKRLFERLLLHNDQPYVGSIVEGVLVRKAGIKFPMRISLSKWQASGQTFLTAIIRDITALKESQALLQKSLDEKTTLLKEVHHRVKNNLQIVSSLLNLEITGDVYSHEADHLKASQDRIKAMALVHNLLYQSESLSHIDLSEYIRKLADQLFESYRANRQLVGLEMDLSEVTVNMDKAVPCGLILNELVTNALKHAFPNGRQGKIQISLLPSGDGKVTLGVKDNGVGLPADFDPERSKSLGMRLVLSLSKQLGGTFSFTCAPCAEFKITFLP